MNVELQETPQDDLLIRLTESRKVEFPKIGKIIVFDRIFWRDPSILKLPFIEGYVPTWTVMLTSILGTISTISEYQIGSKIFFLAKIKEAMASIPANPLAVEPRLLFISAIIGLFGTISLASLYTAYKYFGLSKIDLEKDPLPYTKLVKIFQNTPELDRLPAGNILKMILSKCACWNFINKVRRRERAKKAQNEI